MLQALRRLVSSLIEAPFGIVPAWSVGQCFAC